MNAAELKTANRAVAPDECVWIVDDDPAMRDSLEVLLDSIGIRTRCFGDGRAFLREFAKLDEEHAGGCVLLDQRMPLLPGQSLQRTLKERKTPVPVIIMTAYADVELAVSCMKMGAFDFLQKPVNHTSLIEAVQAAMLKDASRRAAAAGRAEFEAQFATLTSRERQVMSCMISGKSYLETADLLAISKRTVELHRLQVMRKMRVASVVELTAQYVYFRQRLPDVRDAMKPANGSSSNGTDRDTCES